MLNIDLAGEYSVLMLTGRYQSILQCEIKLNAQRGARYYAVEYLWSG